MTAYEDRIDVIMDDIENDLFAMNDRHEDNGVKQVSYELPFGTDSSNERAEEILTKLYVNAVFNPSWMNTILASVGTAAATDDDESLRSVLIRTASLIVEWVNVIDAKAEDTEPTQDVSEPEPVEVASE